MYHISYDYVGLYDVTNGARPPRVLINLPLLETCHGFISNGRLG
jgi:hypothetical protein